jgi:uncharacterized protein YndB with AHSA1/START domain
MDLHEQLGAFERSDDRIDMRFERHYPRSIETVWSALTDPVRLNDWMGAAHVEPRVGGRYELMLDGANPMTGRILIWEPPHVLEFAWSNAHAPESTVRYELSRDGDGVRLVFTHRGAVRESRAHAARLAPVLRASRRLARRDGGAPVVPQLARTSGDLLGAISNGRRAAGSVTAEASAARATAI